MCLFLSDSFAENIRTFGRSAIWDSEELSFFGKVGELLEVERLAQALDHVEYSDGKKGITTDNELRRSYLILSQAAQVQPGTFAGKVGISMAALLRQMSLENFHLDLAALVRNEDYVGAQAASRGVLYYSEVMDFSITDSSGFIF